MKHVLTILAFAMFWASILSQPKSDSLMGVWNNETLPDTVRLSAISTIAANLLFKLPDSAFYHAQKELDFAAETGNKRWMSDALNIQGFSFNIKGHYDTANTYFVKSLQLAKEGGYKRGEAQALNNLGLAHSNLGNELIALDYYIESQEIKEEIGDITGQVSTLINIGGLYEAIKDFAAALEHYSKALILSEKIGFLRGMVASMGNKGHMLVKLGHYDEALQVLSQSHELAEKSGNIQAIARSNGALGIASFEKGDYPKALEYLNTALELAQKFGDRQSTGVALQLIGASHRELGHLDQAVSNGNEALSIAKELKQNIDIRDAAEALYETYSALDEPAKALEMHELFIAMRDSIMSEENQRETIRTEFRKEADKRNAEILLLNAENERKEAQARAERNKRLLTLAIAASLILLISAGGLYLQNMRKQKHKLALGRAELQKNLVENDFLRSRLDPHFVSNALMSINELVNRNDLEGATQYVGRFNSLMRWTLENSSRELVSLNDELEMLCHYVELERPRLEHPIEWSIEVGEGINPEEVELPPLIMQPLLENALKHGLRRADGLAIVTVKIELDGNRLRCSVQDNGQQTFEVMKVQNKSHGIRLTKERLALFSKLHQADAKFDLVNDTSGTVASISFLC